jgi:hypothetical protein
MFLCFDSPGELREDWIAMLQATLEKADVHSSCEATLLMNCFLTDLVLHPSTSNVPLSFDRFLRGEAFYALKHIHCQILHQLVYIRVVSEQ